MEGCWCEPGRESESDEINSVRRAGGRRRGNMVNFGNRSRTPSLAGITIRYWPSDEVGKGNSARRGRRTLGEFRRGEYRN